MSVNVGILGHVDSGKTSLARAISSLGSTAAFDKHAKADNLRANTIDLGYSLLISDEREIALIDCPGHASLIGAVLAASSVFDIALVVVDAQKGVQPQTAEHLLLVSLICSQHVIVVINKVDLVDEAQLKNVQKQVSKALKYFGISSDSPIICISLLEDGVITATSTVIDALRGLTAYEPERHSTGHVVMSVDHCFPIKGKGTVMTGTIIDGECRLGTELEIAALKIKRKVKGIQRWKQDVPKAVMGERVGVLFQDLPPTNLDRTVIFEPGTLEPVTVAIATLNSIQQFKAQLTDRAKIHVYIGFETVMATCQFLVTDGDDGGKEQGVEYEQFAELSERISRVILTFDKPIYARKGSWYIAAKLDMQNKGCRFAFHGNIERIVGSDKEVPRFHRKQRSGVVERVEADGSSVICTQLFKKHSDISVFQGMKVSLSTGEQGRIEGAFGKSGKTRVCIPQQLLDTTLTAIGAGQSVAVNLHMRKYVNSNKLISYVPEDTRMV